ncbi:hypothetical protein T552_00158 [Pneumocystis carinii B80]|uniref:Uncharacterized protein n=1 Tax=Pneumocystis carinii (strain B80) TaxID=1408658 RepID=A0A0W4ZT27_PNEC8|nr:hypothetical protein T552_00158 [Pneumocystis carinii B80]KTW31516.1 hypothetical protein T552_00158 [Pneumocystis carinii B80]
MCIEHFLNNKLKNTNNYRKRELFLCTPPITHMPSVLFSGTRELPAIVVSPATSRDSSLKSRSKPFNFCK